MPRFASVAETVAIYKLRHHLMNLHVRDIDAAMMREYVPIGQGVMDLKAIADAVKAIASPASSRWSRTESCRRCCISLMKEYLS